MPHPAPVLLHTLQNLGNGVVLFGNNPIGGDLACWNWGFTGFAINKVWPSHMFDYLAARVDALGLALIAQNQGRDWLVGNVARLNTVRDTFADECADDWQNASRHAVRSIMELGAEANGLTPSAAVTPYELVVKYDERDGVMPSFDHVWLSINGRCVEVFPGMNDVQIYHGHQDADDGFVMESIYLNDLLQLQVDRIRDTMTNGAQHIRVHPHPAPGLVNPPWIAASTRASCQWCSAPFVAAGKHCHRCGEVFCAACLRLSAAAIDRPAGSTETVSSGPAPVCNRCLN